MKRNLMKKLELAKLVEMENCKREQGLPGSQDEIRCLSFQEKMGLHPGASISCQISGI